MMKKRDHMSITDMTSMAEAQSDLRSEINQRLERLILGVSDYCYQCAKCTSGCESHKLLELEPHQIVALLKRGLIDEMVNSEIIWTCMSCFKCKERCPQKVPPVDILFALKNLAVLTGKKVPGDYTQMLQSVMSIGYIQDRQTVPTRSGDTVKREDLGLPVLSGLQDPNGFQNIITASAVEKI
ncbi:MAG TPA: 4Fe-4S dicluster domain-containing protein [Euryarchaeota archaeon]|nr:4Fe-4S dicluster domain-containing protein [Euryarchaeota archaeon]